MFLVPRLSSFHRQRTTSSYTHQPQPTPTTNQRNRFLYSKSTHLPNHANCRSLKKQSEASKQTSGNNSETIGIAERESTSAASWSAVVVLGTIAEAVRNSISWGRRLLSRRGGRRLGLVDTAGVLGTARMFLTASSRAQVVGAAVLHALSAPSCAHVVGEGEGVLGHVWLLVVAAEAAVLQGFLHGFVSTESSYDRAMPRPHTGSQSLTRGWPALV